MEKELFTSVFGMVVKNQKRPSNLRELSEMMKADDPQLEHLMEDVKFTAVNNQQGKEMSRDDMKEAEDKAFDMARENKSYDEVKAMFPDVPNYALIKWYNYGKMARMKDKNIITY